MNSHLHAVNQEPDDYEPDDYEKPQVIKRGSLNIGVKTFIGIAVTLMLGWLGGIIYLIETVAGLLR